MRSKLAASLMSAVACALTAASTPASAQPDPAPIRATPERPFLLLDQVRSGPVPSELNPQIQALNTLEDIEALLSSKGIAFERRKGSVDTRTFGAELAKIIADLPPGEVFVIPGKDVVTFNQVIRALTPGEAAALQAKGPATPL